MSTIGLLQVLRKTQVAPSGGNYCRQNLTLPILDLCQKVDYSDFIDAHMLCQVDIVHKKQNVEGALDKPLVCH